MLEVSGAVPVYGTGRQIVDILLEAQVQGCTHSLSLQKAEEGLQMACLVLLRQVYKSQFQKHSWAAREVHQLGNVY